VEELKKNWFTPEEENRIQKEVKREAKSKERAKRLIDDGKIPSLKPKITLPLMK